MSSRFIKFSCSVCLFACIGDFVIMFYLGLYYPGYSQLKDTMSSLGATISPVSAEISAWWILVGLLFIIFGLGFMQAFRDKGKYTTIATWLIILYGVGEGIGSGVFKADHIGDSMTISCMIHDALGGVGIAAILFLPLLMKKIISKAEMPAFYRMSTIVFVMGILALVLFSFRVSNNNNNLLNVYQGLWQRLMMLNSYVYLAAISIIMWKNKSGLSKSTSRHF